MKRGEDVLPGAELVPPPSGVMTGISVQVFDLETGQSLDQTLDLFFFPSRPIDRELNLVEDSLWPAGETWSWSIEIHPDSVLEGDLHVQAEGYGTHDQTVEVDAGSTAFINVELAPIPEPKPVPKPVPPTPRLDEPDSVDVATTKRLTFSTTPSSASISIQGVDGAGRGRSYTLSSGTPKDVPDGLYEYLVSAPNFRDETGSVDLRGISSETLAVTLLSDVVARSLRDADAAYDRGEWGAAIRWYRQMSRPAQMRGTTGETYAESRFKLARALAYEGDLTDAVEVFETVLEVRPSTYAARLNLGRVYCELREFGQGIMELRKLRGGMLNTVPVERRTEFDIRASAEVANCRFDEYELDRRTSPSASSRQARSALRSFIAEARLAVEEGKIQAEALTEIEALVKEAEDRVRRLR